MKIEILELLELAQQYGQAQLYELESGQPNIFIKFQSQRVAVNITIQEENLLDFSVSPARGYVPCDEIALRSAQGIDIPFDLFDIQNRLEKVALLKTCYYLTLKKDTNEKHKPKTSRSACNYLKSTKRTIQRTLASWFRKL